MLRLLSVILSLIAFNVTIADDKKVYTEKEFKKAVKKEVEQTIDRIKKKNLAQLTKEILEKEAVLDQKLKLLEEREKEVAMSEDSLNNKIVGFETRQKEILGCIDKNKKNELMRINQLVEVISNMKPAKAAEILSVQEAQISVKIIERIDPSRASKIFNLMEKEVSARLQKQYLNMQQ